MRLDGGHATYTFFDERSAGRMLTPQDMPVLNADVSALYLGGISLACEPGADAYAALLKSEGPNRPVMIDPNIRPGFIDDVSAYRARLDTAMTQADVVKVSDEDLGWLVSGQAPLKDKAMTLLDRGLPR